MLIHAKVLELLKYRGCWLTVFCFVLEGRLGLTVKKDDNITNNTKDCVASQYKMHYAGLV